MRRSIAGSKAASLGLLALAEVAAMALWFSASAVVPSLAATHEIGAFQQSLFTSAVQAGFVAGSLTSAVLGLADRLEPRRFFAASALAGALANTTLLIIEPSSFWVAVPRFLTGAAMAGVYPVGMKMASTWAKGDLGLLVGLLVGALTLGSAAPHLFNAFGGLEWRFTLAAASVSAALASGLVLLVGIGPRVTAMPRFRPAMVLWAWKIRPLRLANLGYLGHMWELYAMWAWIGAFFHASFALAPGGTSAVFSAKLAAFATVGSGAIGCLAGGLLADRLGRTTITMAAMAISGSCALTVGFFYGGNPAPLVFLCLIWGITIVADSAQFSASVTELSNRFLVGTMLTLQTALGFTLTLVTIHLMPLWLDLLGWRYAFMPLAIGPFLGVVAMGLLRADPRATNLAGGRR